jgi:hypothetical protein
MSGILSASMTVRRREEAFLVRSRMDRIDAQLGQLLAEVGASPSSPPEFTNEDVAEVGRWLVEGRVRLPSHVKITVITEIETVRSKVVGASEVYTHTCDQLHAHRMRPMSIPAALKAGLLVRLNGSWLWSESAYRRLVPPDPRQRT